MSQPRADEPLRLSDPKVVAAALAFGGKLLRTEPTSNGRLDFLVANVPANFVLMVASDDVTVSARAFIASMETVLGLIAQHQRARRW